MFIKLGNCLINLDKIVGVEYFPESKIYEILTSENEVAIKSVACAQNEDYDESTPVFNYSNFLAILNEKGLLITT